MASRVSFGEGSYKRTTSNQLRRFARRVLHIFSASSALIAGSRSSSSSSNPQAHPHSGNRSLMVMLSTRTLGLGTSTSKGVIARASTPPETPTPLDGAHDGFLPRCKAQVGPPLTWSKLGRGAHRYLSSLCVLTLTPAPGFSGAHS